jgi:Fe2+ transport system protein FeoA
LRKAEGKGLRVKGNSTSKVGEVSILIRRRLYVMTMTRDRIVEAIIELLFGDRIIIPTTYRAFVLAPDGHNIEAVCHTLQ